MSKVLVTESSLARIAAAIRAKNGSSDTYKPGQMAEAIAEIPTGTTPSGTIDITQNGTTDVTNYASANVNVPNSYAAGDEGKVVSNGALVAQTARASEITSNGTYDTTLNDEVTVNVSGGGGGGAVVPLADNLYATSGSYTYSKTITIQEAGSYTIAVQAYSNNLTVKINDTAQSLVIEKPGDYTRLYKATVSLSVGDVIDIYATSSGWSSVTAFIIKDQEAAV